MPRRGGIPAPWWPESPLPRRLTRTAAIAHALADHVLREVGLAAHHAAPPANRPDHTGRPEIVVKHLFAALSPVPCPRLGFLKVVPEGLRPYHVTRWLGLSGLRGLRSLCWRCARLGGGLALGGAGSTGRALCLALRCLLRRACCRRFTRAGLFFSWNMRSSTACAFGSSPLRYAGAPSALIAVSVSPVMMALRTKSMGDLPSAFSPRM